MLQVVMVKQGAVVVYLPVQREQPGDQPQSVVGVLV
jgi:hypothetical protein